MPKLTKKDFQMIATVIWRAGYVADKNNIKQVAREKMRVLIASGFIGELKKSNPKFDESRFLKACGINQ